VTLSWHPDSVQSPLDLCSRFAVTALDRFFRPGIAKTAWRPVLFELGDSPRSLGGLISRAAALSDDVHVPKLYRDQNIMGQGPLTAATLFVRQRFLADPQSFQALVAGGGQMRRIEIGAVVDDAFLDFDRNPEVAPDAEVNVEADAVIMAVIDHGIAFAHDLFRVGMESRVAFAWIMDAAPAGGASATSIGRMLNKAEIDALLGASGSGALFDEDRFYRQAGLIDYAVPGFKPAALRRSHGTHVLSQAAGYRTGGGNRPIICVQLPTLIAGDPSGRGLAPLLNLALEYILAKASLLRRPDGTPPPVVINFSYGNYAGPHDGTALIEKEIDRKLKRESKQAKRMVLPVGNGQLKQCHAQLRFPPGRNENRLTLRLQPNDRTASYLQIWLPANTVDPRGMVKVSVTPPGGSESPFVGKADETYLLKNRQGDVVGALCFSVSAASRRGLVTLATAPTDSLVTHAGLAPAGLWRIRIQPGTITPEDVLHAWVERDETLPGFRSAGRQSYFEDPRYQRLDPRGRPLPDDPPVPGTPIRRSSTLNGFAAGMEPVVVGGWVAADGAIADYSAAGPALVADGADETNRIGPDAVAVSDRSAVRRGIFGAGSRSGSHVAMNGSSVAAPQAARLMADDLGRGGSGARARVRAIAATDETDHPAPIPPQSEARRGAGRLKQRFRL